MKRFSRLFFLLALVFGSVALRAQIPAGALVGVFPCTPSKLMADPHRPRIYALDPPSNSLIVIDTEKLRVLATIPLGAYPVDMAMSLDGGTLYIARYGSNLPVVSVLDLGTLALRRSLPLPAGKPLAVAAGLQDRVYASVADADSIHSAIYQFDGKTGRPLATFNESLYANGSLLITPDGHTLFVDSGDEGFGLSSFDVSTATSRPLQFNGTVGNAGSPAVISHNGKYLCFPESKATGSSGITELFSTADITRNQGGFNVDRGQAIGEFSADDSLFYLAPLGTGVVRVFNTGTRRERHALTIPSYRASSGYVLAIAPERTDSYLFVSQAGPYAGQTINARLSYLGPRLIPLGHLEVLGTGRGKLLPPVPLLGITAPHSTVTVGAPATITFSRVGDLSKELTADYSIRGAAKNGVDYVLLPGKVTIPARESSATIQLVANEVSAPQPPPATGNGRFAPPPGVGPAYEIRKVSLTLRPSASYSIGDARVRLSIFCAIYLQDH